MKKFAQIGFLLIIVASIFGCATPYIVDRNRDAADIFTAAVGERAGAKARIGPLHVGALIEVINRGLAGGVFLSKAHDFFGHGFEIDLTFYSI